VFRFGERQAVRIDCRDVRAEFDVGEAILVDVLDDPLEFGGLEFDVVQFLANVPDRLWGPGEA